MCRLYTWISDIKPLSNQLLDFLADRCTYRSLIVAVVNVKEEPGSNTVSTSGVGVGGVSVPSGMMGSAASSGVSTTGFAPVEFQTRSKCFM